MDTTANSTKQEATSSPEAGVASVEVETRDDLSFLYKFIRSCILRPLRPKLISIKDEHPAGSPRLTKRPSTLRNMRIVERKVQITNSPEIPLPQVDEATNSQNMWLYDFQSPAVDGKQEFTRTIYYFAGGGFRAPPSNEHWKFCARLANELRNDGVRVIVVSYPLAPNSPARFSLPLIQAWLLQELQSLSSNARSNERVTLMGDSAGGNIVVCLAFWAAIRLQKLQSQAILASKDSAEHEKLTMDIEALQKLDHIITASPPMDFRNVNPAIDEANKVDPILTKDLTDGVADDWVKDYIPGAGASDNKANPSLSPCLQSTEAWKALSASGIRLDGCFGTCDVLGPDCEVFLQKCQSQNLKGSWLVWKGQMHCFPLLSAYGLMEGKEGLNWICRQIRLR